MSLSYPSSSQILNLPHLHSPKPFLSSSQTLKFKSPLTLTPNPTPNPTPMASNSDSDLLHQFLFFNVYKNGHVTIFSPPMQTLPANDDPLTGVKIKDVQISGDLSARLFLPPITSATKLPVLLYVHGGAFCMQSAFSLEYTRFLTRLSSAANLIAVSVEYGLFPARPIPACYDDSWLALNWILSRSGSAPDPWIQTHGDLSRVFIAGDSAGGNICHTLAVRAGSGGLRLSGAILIHPYFGEDDRMWMYMCPTNEGPRDRRMKPAAEDLARIGCGRVLVIVGERDGLRNAGTGYVDDLIKSGWKGTVEIMENKERDHCFHLGDPEDDEAIAIQNRIISFIYSDQNSK